MTYGNSSLLLDFWYRKQSRVCIFHFQEDWYNKKTLIRWICVSCTSRRSFISKFVCNCNDISLKKKPNWIVLNLLGSRSVSVICVVLILLFNIWKYPGDRLPLNFWSLCHQRHECMLSVVQTSWNPLWAGKKHLGARLFLWTHAKQCIIFPHESELYWDHFSFWVF